MRSHGVQQLVNRAATRALVGEGVYSYFHVLPSAFEIKEISLDKAVTVGEGG